MDETDKKEFSQALGTVSEIYNKNVSANLYRLYFETLKRFSIQDVLKAISRASVDLKWFPKPVELIELIEGKIEDIAEIECNKVFEAIRRVGSYSSICFDDQITQSVISQHFGGWIKMCNEMMEETLHFSKKDFVKAYCAFKRTGMKHGGHLIGIHEAENGPKVKPVIKMIGNPETCKQIMENKTGQENLQISDYQSILKQIGTNND